MQSKSRKSLYFNCATTTAKDWGFSPAPCKGGKTRNSTSKKKSGGVRKGERKK